MLYLIRNNKNIFAVLMVGVVSCVYFLSHVSFANAQQCPQPTGAVIVNHEVCVPPGQPPYGRDGTPCEAVGLKKGGYVQGICQTGCCRAVAYTPDSSVFSGFGGDFIEGVAQGIVVQTAMGFINNLISGGLGTDPYSGSGGTQYGYVDDISTFLDITDDYNSNTNDGGFNLNFDDDTSDNTNDRDSIFTLTDNDKPNTTVTGGNTSPSTNTGTKTTQTGDSVTTSYESLGGGSRANTVGNTEFGQELLDNLDDPTYTSGLSLAELERAAEEARRREALLNEQNAGTGDIGDYRSSNISQAGSNNDPLADGYYDSLGTDEKQLTWWQRILMFITQSLGL